MQFHLTQHFHAPLPAVVHAYLSPALYETMHGFHHIGAPEVLDVRAVPDAGVVRLRYRFVAPVPRAALSVIDPTKLTWVDETHFDLERYDTTTVLHPDHYAHRFSGRASSTFGPDPRDPSGTVRHLHGEITVRVPLVGGRVEEAIVAGLREHVVDEAACVDAFVAAHHQR